MTVLRRYCPNCREAMSDADVEAGLLKCSDTNRCLRKAMADATKTMATRPYVGFDPDAAYRDAPKMGDQA